MIDVSVPRFRRMLGALALAGASVFLIAPPGVAQDAPAAPAAPAAPGQAPVVATLNGTPITQEDLVIAAQEFGDQIARLPPDRQQSALLDVIIDIRLLSTAAVGEGLDKDPGVEKRVEFAKDRALRNEYLKEKVFQAVTPDTVKKRFDEDLAKFVPGDELHLRHILVKTEDEGKAIIAELDKGGDFAAIAKAKSIDPGSAAQGGDLGWIGHGKTVKPFEDAAFKLEVGKYTEQPVQSDFGWHIIKLEEKRKEAPPTFDDQAEQIRQQMIRETFNTEIKALRDAAKIDILQPPPAPPTPPDAPQPPAPAQ